MVNRNILKIRKELDKLDNSLLEIIKKRTKLVDLVIKNKKFKKDIIDKKRTEVISLKEQIDLMSVCFAVDKSLKLNKTLKIKYY